MTNLCAILLLSFASIFARNDEVKLLFVGDAMQHGPQIEAAKQPDGSFDYSPCFANIKDEISSADLAVVNLECPLAGPPYRGYPQFSAPDAYAQALKDAGFDFFLTANNHCLDSGDRGARRTLNALDSLGIPHIGTYRNPADRDSLSPQILDVKGLRIGFVAATYDMNGFQPQKDFIVDRIDTTRLCNELRQLRVMGADITCVLIHWGIEYQLLPSESQKRVAKTLLNAGADLIIGSHPHVLQPFELTYNTATGRNALIVYSLGNFISNQNDNNSRGGAMVEVTIDRSLTGLNLKNAGYRLVFVQKPENGIGNYRLIPVTSGSHEDHRILPSSKDACKTFIRNALHLMNNHNINVPELPPFTPNTPNDNKEVWKSFIIQEGSNL